MKNTSIVVSYCINIPENATNGDIIKAMFPNVKTSDNGDDFITYTFGGIVGNVVEKDWWNAPYKAESEE